MTPCRSLILAGLLGSAVASAAAFQTEGGGSARVAAQVLDGITREPLANVAVRLTPGTHVTTTDAAGRFRLDGVAPGDYTLHATRAGYMDARLDGRRMPGSDGIPLVLASGDDLAGELRLYPAAIVSGRIIGMSGRPAQGLEVTPFRWAYNGLGEREAVFHESRTTNDLGEFRFNALDPGEYGFRVQGSEAGLTEARASLFRPFYYPGAGQREQAEAVVIESGETRLRDLFVPTVQAEGRIHVRPVDLFGNEVSGPSEVAVFARAEQGAIRSGTLVPGASGTTGSVPYGRYDVIVTHIAERAMMSGRTTIDLQSAEVDAEVTLAPMRSLTGRATSASPEGGLPRPVAGVVLGFLDTTSFQRFGRELEVSLRSRADGSIRSDALSEDVAYHVRVVELPAEMSLSSITYGGESVLGRAFYVDPRGDAELLIDLAAGAATVRGRIVGNDGAPVSLADVALLPDDRGRVELFRAGRADWQGRYEIRNVAPGAYRLYAWRELDGPAYQNADFMSAFEAQGVPVLIETPGPLTVDLTAPD